MFDRIVLIGNLMSGVITELMLAYTLVHDVAL
jgi:hypothetical protein